LNITQKPFSLKIKHKREPSSVPAISVEASGANLTQVTSP
jgi:hypothetical protein